MPLSLQTLIDGLALEVVGDRDRPVEGAQPLEFAGPRDMAFLASKEKLASALKSRAGVLFVRPEHVEALHSEAEGASLVVSENPKDAFFAALVKLRPSRTRTYVGQSPHAFIHPNARIGTNTNVHPGATIESGVVIGSNCDIHAGVYIGAGVQIGDHVQLHPNVVVYHDTLIGNRVVVQAGSVVGAEGFGYQTRNGRHERIPHCGIVRICDDVDVGACSTIDRAVLGETVIGEGTKIDNNVVIAHNCHLGRHNLLVSQVGFAGSVTTGDYVVCAGQVGVADHVNIGTGAILGAKAGIHKDLPGGKTYLGTPAAPIAETTRAVMALQKLPQMRQTLRDLERQVAELKNQIESQQRSAA